MQNRIVNKLLITIFGTCLVLSTSAWSGSIDDAYNSMGMYSNTTNPSAFQGQAANYYSGGSLFLRSPTTNYRPITWDPPRFRGGCGGIDAYLGSFSNINLDGFIAMLKNIGSNATGLAFQLAIDELSPLLAGNLKNLSDRLSKLSEMNISSCKAAKAAFASLKEKWTRDREDTSQTLLKGEGISPDDNDARSKSADPAQQDAADNAAQSEPATKNMIPLGNIVWKALVLNGPSDFSDEQRQIAISLVGTFIVTKDPGSKDPHFSIVGPSGITFEMVMLGNMSDGVTSTTATGFTAGTLDYLPVLICDRYEAGLLGNIVDEDSCLYSKSNPTQTGMDRAWLKDLFNEDGQIPYLQKANAVLKNIMDNILSGNSTGQGQQEIDLIANSSLPVYKMAAVATAMPGGGLYFREKYAGLIGADRAAKYYESLLDAVHLALLKYKSNAPASFIDYIDQITGNADKFRTGMYQYMTKMKMDTNNANVMAEELIVAERKLFTHMSPQLRNNYSFGH